MNKHKHTFFAAILLTLFSTFANASERAADPAMLATADLRVTIAASSDTVAVGENVTYTITVCNDGPDTALAPAVTRAFPGATLVSTTPTVLADCNGTQTFPPTNSLLAPGFGIRFTDTVRADVVGTLSYRAFTTGFIVSDPNPANNEATVQTTVVPSVNVPPVISVVPGGACNSDLNGVINIAFADPDTPENQLVITAISSDQSIIPDSSLVLADIGVAGRQTLAIGAAQHAEGNAVVTVTVSDGVAAASVAINVQVGSNYSDILVGSDETDVLFGSGGPDILIGRAGNDLLCGGKGRDTIIGGAGGDVFSGGAGSDYIVDFRIADGDTSDGS